MVAPICPIQGLSGLLSSCLRFPVSRREQGPDHPSDRRRSHAEYSGTGSSAGARASVFFHCPTKCCVPSAGLRLETRISDLF